MVRSDWIAAGRWAQQRYVLRLFDSEQTSIFLPAEFADRAEAPSRQTRARRQLDLCRPESASRTTVPILAGDHGRRQVEARRYRNCDAMMSPP